jgi:flagellar hook assembly protein FlgD
MRARRLAAAALFIISGFAHAAPALRVTYGSDNVSRLNWTTVSGASWYDIERTTLYPGWSLQQRLSSGNAGWSDPATAAGATYVYRVVPRDGALNPVGAPSNVAIVSTHTHAANPLGSGAVVAAQHMTDLRTVLRSISLAAGNGEPVWTNAGIAQGSAITAQDVADLRSVFNAAMNKMGGPLPAFASGLASGVPLQAAHFQQLRDLARAFPEHVTASAAITNPWFSPNGDSSLDSTTFNATVILRPSPRFAFRWRLDVRNFAGTAVRTVSGTGTTVGFVWDGSNGSGIVQPEGEYTFELADVDSLSLPIVTATARIDVTAPVATISAPVDQYVLSNVHTAASTDLVISGTATDEGLLESWRTERALGEGPFVSMTSGTSSVSGGTLATWRPVAGASENPNGDYKIRLSVADRAGNTSSDTSTVRLAHFSVLRSEVQVRHADGETVTYTSVVPFTMTERLEIWSGSTLVRTLVNTARSAGTYMDVWDGRNAQNQLVADGAYRFIAVATAAASTFTWDRSTVYPDAAATQHPYPKCWSGTAWVACSDTTVSFDFDPFAVKPLRIAWCVGAGEPDSGCTGTTPAFVVAKVSDAVETDATCDYGCVVSDFLPAGRQEVRWYGVSVHGDYVADLSRLTVIRQPGAVPVNYTILYGTAPVINSVDIVPVFFTPGSVVSPVAGQVFTLGISRFAGRSVTVTAVIRNLEHAAPLRTITSNAQTSDIVSVTWDGRADNGMRAAAGKYEVRLTVTDANGSKMTVTPVVVVRY